MTAVPVLCHQVHLLYRHVDTSLCCTNLLHVGQHQHRGRSAWRVPGAPTAQHRAGALRARFGHCGHTRPCKPTVWAQNNPSSSAAHAAKAVLSVSSTLPRHPAPLN